MSGFAEHVERVRREVRDGGGTVGVILERRYPGSADDLWEACTEPDRLARWFEPVDGDLREGGRYRLQDTGTAGTVERCDPPRFLRVTWEYGGDVSHVELTLAPDADGVALRVEHRFVPDAHWEEFGPGAAGTGWDLSLLALALHRDGDARAEPAAMERFAGSPDGVALLRAVTAHWARVHVATGATPAAARAAADRALAFYTAGAPAGPT